MACCTQLLVIDVADVIGAVGGVTRGHRAGALYLCSGAKLTDEMPPRGGLGRLYCQAGLRLCRRAIIAGGAIMY